MNGYELSRNWFDFCFLNPDRIKPTHTALYFFIIEHCNRLGWKEKFGLPTTMAKEAIGIHSYNTYINTLNDLVEFGFVKMIQKSKNQYSSNIVALSNFDKAHDKALDKALIKHVTKQSESTIQSISSINKQRTINNKQGKKFIPPTINDVKTYCLERKNSVDAVKFINHYQSNGWMVGKNKMKDWKAAIRTWEGNSYSKPQTTSNPTYEKL